MHIDYPSGDRGFVEYKRAFCVWGSFDGTLPQKDDRLTVELFSKNGECVRKVTASSMYPPADIYNKSLTAYPESRDPGRKELCRFGFPELCYDPSEPDSIRNASLKAWFSENEFKGVILSASGKETGALADDGMHLLHDGKAPYFLLPTGEYTLRASLYSKDGELRDMCQKPVTVGAREDQLICRFNPEAHKEKMIKWCEEMGFSVISDPLPGYLDSYLGDWSYHKGLLQMYRANDIALFEKAKIRMFVYQITQDSTSYETELAYLQKSGRLFETDSFFAYHYDIGEALCKNAEGELFGSVTEFPSDKYMAICRTDTVKSSAVEGEYRLDGKDTLLYHPADTPAKIKQDGLLAVMGVLRPMPQSPDDFALREDNTYEIKNAPSELLYTFSDGEHTVEYRRNIGLTRKGDGIFGVSVLEFYNIFHLSQWKKGANLAVNVICFDKYGSKMPAKASFLVEVV